MGVESNPGIAVSYDRADTRFLERVVDIVDYVELAPDSLAVVEDGRLTIPEHTFNELEAFAGEVHFIVHGVGLSIASASGWNKQYLTLVDQLVERLDVRWHSEHLGLTTVEDENLGTMLPAARSQESMELVCARVRDILARYGLPFLLENVVRVIPEAPADYSEAGFLSELVSTTGCGLLVDVYNLQCDEHNYGFDVEGFIEQLPLEAVAEIHVAGGVVERGMRLDVHSNAAMPSTLQLAADVTTRASHLGAVTYEFLADAVELLGHDFVRSELERLRVALTSE